MKIRLHSGEVLETTESYARRAIAFGRATGIPETEDGTIGQDGIPQAEDGKHEEANRKKGRRAKVEEEVEACL